MLKEKVPLWRVLCKKTNHPVYTMKKDEVHPWWVSFLASPAC